MTTVKSEGSVVSALLHDGPTNTAKRLELPIGQNNSIRASVVKPLRAPMVRVVVAARTNRVSPALPVIVSDGLNGYSLSGDGRRPRCHQTLLGIIKRDQWFLS